MTEIRRARSLEEYVAKVQKLGTEGGMANAAAFKARPDDILVSTFAKAGTTWMQQIVHGLRTCGDMNFREVTDVVPWIELAHDVGWDIHGEQVANPRAYKTHAPYEAVTKGAKYIWIVREPKDSALSFFNFMNGWFIEPGTISADEFVQNFYVGDHLFGGYWAHLLGWWSVKDNTEVLPLSFEDMKQDLASAVHKVANFMDMGEDAAAIDVATRQAEFSFMKQHESQFDDHPVAVTRNAEFHLPAEARSSKVKTGSVGGHKAGLSAETIALLDEKWAATIEKELGFKDYEALRAAI